jgi:hypothetical protein
MNGQANEWLSKANDDLQAAALLLTFEIYPRNIVVFPSDENYTIERML